MNVASAGGLKTREWAGLNTHRQSTFVEVDSRERRSDRPGVQHGAADVPPGVDAAHDEIRSRPERSHTAGDHDEGREGIDAVGGDSFETGELHSLDDDAVAHRVDGAHAGSSPACFPKGGGDDELVSALQQLTCEVRQTRRRHAVVVRHKNADHFSSSVLPGQAAGVALRYRAMTDVPDGGDTPASPSGRQSRIATGKARAVAVEVGGGLRQLAAGGEPVLWGYLPSEVAGGGRGQVLAPWPNRLEDGSYRFGEVTGRAALDEPEHHNAIHGLVRWLLWSVREQTGSRVVLGCELAPQPAYPWRLAVEMAYDLSDDGLVVEAKAENRSTTAAPFGMGVHPYLAGGGGGIDGSSVTISGETPLAARRAWTADELGCRGRRSA